MQTTTGEQLVQTPSPSQGGGSPRSGGEGSPSRIAATFARLKDEGRVALMPYLTVGYPDIETTSAAVPAMVRAGADLIELGMPFSDPLMDGPTVQRTNQIAIARGFKGSMMFDVAREIREMGIETPLVLMGSFNMILRYGAEPFVAECAAAGIDGLIIPDLPPEESQEIEEACKRHGRDLIWLVAPTSSDERIAEIARRASGFIYCISLVGITGERVSLTEGLAEYIARVRRFTDLPLAVGFGISRAEHVAQVGAVADGAIVASALLNRVAEVEDRPVEEQVAVIEEFVRGLLPQS
jgi:tryptophan synthase alpha chain